MSLDIHRTSVVRKKLASFKNKIQTAGIRTEKAKLSLQVVEERFNRTTGMKSKMEDLISKRGLQLEQAETRTASIQRKWDALVRFCEEMNVLVPAYDQVGIADYQLDTKIAHFTKKTEKAEKKYKASVDRVRVLRDQIERARTRHIRAEMAARVLQQQLAVIKERVQVLEKRKLERVARKCQMEGLEAKVKQALARAQQQENMETEQEGRIIELEDKIGMYTHKKKHAFSILANRDNHKSIESWTISLWFQSSNNLLTDKSSIPISIDGANNA